MKKILNKINNPTIYIILLITLLQLLQINQTTFATEIPSSTEQSNLTLYSKADILLDAKTGKILYENNSTEKLYPASTTKLMTAILTLENCQLTDSVTITPEMLNGIPKSYTTAALRAGETLTVDQLMHVLLIPSAKDAANVLAYHISGSIPEFAKKMNERAQVLGCKNTNFKNPSGIHDEEHYSTAYDMAQIGQYAYGISTIREIAGTHTYSLPDLPDGKQRTFKTTNTLITEKNKYHYEYATGLKTGYTDKAKSCIVATAKKDDVELLCVVLGGDKTEEKESQRELDCITLFNYGFNNYEYKTLCTIDENADLSSITDIPKNLKDTNLAYSETLNILLKKDKPISSSINLDSNIKLPIYKGTHVGTITYSTDDENYTVNLVTTEDILPQFPTYIYYVLLAFLVIILILALMKKKKSKKSKYFRHSFY